MVDAQAEYNLPAGVLEVSRVDVMQSSDDSLLFSLPNGTWEITGDVFDGTAKLFINSRYSNPSHYLRVHGYGSYDLTTTLPPDIYVPFILATARAEAWRTMISSRARFENWMKLNQKENVSVNELSQMIAQAEQEAERHRARMKTWRKPKPAR